MEIWSGTSALEALAFLIASWVFCKVTFSVLLSLFSLRSFVTVLLVLVFECWTTEEYCILLWREVGGRAAPLTTYLSILSCLQAKHRVVSEYKCEYCPYTCKSTNALANHKNRRHAHNTPAQPSDPAAGKSAAQSPPTVTGARKKEKKAKVPEKLVIMKSICKPNFKCAVCTAEFVRKDSLKSHLNQIL